MKVKFKRPAFIGGVLYDADRIYDIPENVFAQTVEERPEPVPEKDERRGILGLPEGAIVLDDNVSEEDHSSTPKTAPGTKDFKGTLIGREGYVETGREPQHNEETEPSPDAHGPIGGAVNTSLKDRGDPIKADPVKPFKSMVGENKALHDEFGDDKPSPDKSVKRPPIKL